MALSRHSKTLLKEDFVDAVKKGYPIIHLEAYIGVDHIKFEDGDLPALQLRDVLSLDLSKTELIVLSACESFRVGKALEDSRIKYSIVAQRNLPITIGKTFYDELYRQITKSATIEKAYERAIVYTNVKHNLDAKELLMLSQYKK